MMKILLSFSLVFILSAVGFSKTYDDLSPEKRLALASDWLDTGKAFQANKKFAKAKNCFTYVVEIYPMGPVADEARQILKESFKKTLKYDADKVYAGFVAMGDNQDKAEYKINDYLMALIVKQDKELLQKIAVQYLKTGDKEKAKEYLDKAIAAGLAKESIDPGLQGL